MENLDVKVLQALCEWRAAGQRALLVTVVRTWGSSPRPVGSILALRGDGVVVGSVSGGCIEDDLIHRYVGAFSGGPGNEPEARLLALGQPCFLKYGVTADEAHRFGLPCGGTLELLVEFDPQAQALEALVEALLGGQLMQRRVRLSDGQVSLAAALQPAALERSDTDVVNTFGPAYRLLIIGAGQMSEYLATMARFCGLAVTVCDPRSEHSASWSLAGVALLDGMPDDVVVAFAPDRRTAVVALSHDPKLDDLALLEALKTPAFYVGAIGSRRNNAARRRRLVEHFAVTETELERLRGPIGLYIGSKTPPEIAVSVMAEILAVKNGVSLPREMDVAAAKGELPEATSDATAAPVCGAAH